MNTCLTGEGKLPHQCLKVVVRHWSPPPKKKPHHPFDNLFIGQMQSKLVCFFHKFLHNVLFQKADEFNLHFC